MALIPYERSVVVACDVHNLEKFQQLVSKTYPVSGIGGYKVGLTLALGYGLQTVAHLAKGIANKPVIYDHQKGGTDIPPLGKDFAAVCKRSGVDAVILFPQSGPATEEAWIKACQDVGLDVLVGGEMTHPKYKRSEGGFIADEALDEMYLNAARLGVRNFVVPGNKPEAVSHYRELLLPIVREELTLFAPGFVKQGGVISDTGKVAGSRWHAIVGGAIYDAQDIQKAAEEMTSQLYL